MKRLLPLAFLLALTSPFWDLGHPLWERDDARYAEVPREMVESGDWLTPTLNYLSYIEKPPLMYWLCAASYKLFGVNEAAARLPLALLALLGILCTWWLGSWLYSAETGMAAAVILATCAQYFGLSHVLTPDMAVSVALLWTTALILRCLRRPEDGRWAGALAWVAAITAFLSKGLIGLLLPAVWTIGLLVLFPALRKGLRPLLLNWGMPVFIIVLGAWLAAMESNHPGFLNFFFIEQHFQRFLTAKYNRPGPWYFFFAIEFAGSMPWTPLILAAILEPLAGWRRSDPRDLQLSLWVALVFIFFTVSSSKLLTYILPLFAHQAVLGARLMGRLAKSPRLERGVRCGAVAIGVVFAAACVLAPFVAPRLGLPFALPTGVLTAAMVFLTAMAATQLLLARGQFTSGGGQRALAGIALLALTAYAMPVVGTRLITDELSVKSMTRDLNARIAALDSGKSLRLLSYDFYPHGVSFYTGLPVDMINWVGELHYAKRFPQNKHRFGDDEKIWDLPIPGRRTFVILERTELRHFIRQNPPEEVRRLTQHGPWVLAEF
ncbi:ArnT family glycosyltransferase [Elusimicrobiota bacterium]